MQLLHLLSLNLPSSKLDGGAFQLTVARCNCCIKHGKATLRSLVTGLVNLPIGARGRIVFVAPRYHDRMDRLAAFGVVPGSELRLRQKAPSLVLELGETTIALDAEIAREIYVKQIV